VTDVAALVIGGRGDCLPAIGREAVADVVTLPSLANVVTAAAEARAALLWLIDSGAMPAEGSLQWLLDAGCDLCVSLPVDREGRPVEPLIGRFTENDVPGILEAASKHRVPLRHTYVISLLARRETVIAAASPDAARFGRYAGSEWTARLFSRQPGMLVPSSTVRAPVLRAGRPQHALRMARTGMWSRGEALREFHRCAVGPFARARAAPLAPSGR
jgi:hypothetical protein